MFYFFLGIGILFLGAFLVLFIKDRWKGSIIIAANGLSFCSFLYFSLNIFFYGTQNFILPYPDPIGDILFSMDYLSIFFILFISFFSFMNSIYAKGYLKGDWDKKKGLGAHYFFYNLMILAMLLVVTIQNAAAFIIAWEIMSISSFFLVLYDQENEESNKAALYYFIAMHISVLFLIFGFAYLALKTGSFSFETFKDYLQIFKGESFPIFLVFFIGFGFKAGFVPLHTWLPKAHPASPTHISALMSGVMIKTGLYGIIRILSLLNNPTAEIGYLILALGLFTAFYGIVYSTSSIDLKEILAYSSIENIGIILSGLGMGILGLAYQNHVMAVLSFSGAFLHILNHGLFKTLLFYGAGAVYQKTHVRNIEKLGGLNKFMPYTSFCFFIGVIAISALPPLNGFVSEFLIFMGIFKGLKITASLSISLIFSLGVLSLVGAIAVLSFTRLYSIVFQGSPREINLKEKSDVAHSMRFPMFANVIIMFAVAFSFQWIYPFIEKTVNQLFGIKFSNDSLVFLQTFTFSFGIFIIMILFLILIKKLLLKNRDSKIDQTWNCGYQAVTPKLQYTGSSYSGIFLSLTHFLFRKEKKGTVPVGFFPKKSYFLMAYSDIFNQYIVKPVINGLNYFLNLFSWVQNGSMQRYILYILLFLLFVVIWVMVNR